LDLCLVLLTGPHIKSQSEKPRRALNRRGVEMEITNDGAAENGRRRDDPLRTIGGRESTPTPLKKKGADSMTGQKESLQSQRNNKKKDN